MAGQTTANIAVKVKPTVAIGASTVAGGSVTLVAYVLAIIAFLDGARDEETIGALTAGTVALVTTLVGRYAQATAAIKAAAPPVNAPLAPVVNVARERTVNDDDLAEDIDRLYSRVHRLEREAGHYPQGTDSDQVDGDVKSEARAYMTGDEGLLDNVDVDFDVGAPTGRETDGAPELDDVDEAEEPSESELGVASADIRTVEAHRDLRDPSERQS